MTTVDVRWHELELVVTIARAGSATAAAVELGTSQSTVSRKLGALEKRLGVKLFDRQAHRLLPTPAGHELASAAGAMETSVQAALHRIAGRDARPQGRVHISGMAPLLRLAMPALATVLDQHPSLDLELDARPVPVSLARGEADIAIRVSADPPPTLVGRKVARFAYALYQLRGAADPAASVIAFPRPRGDIAGRSWLAEVVDNPRVRVRIDRDELHLDAVRHGMGVAQVPCLLGDADPLLQRVRDAPIEWGDWLWVLTHESLRDVMRVRVFLDALTERMTALRPLIEGECGTDPSDPR